MAAGKEPGYHALLPARVQRRLRTDYGGSALILGGSDGIGLAFARELAAAGFNLVLAARRKAHLDRAAEDLKGRFPVKVSPVTLDLAEPGAWESLKRLGAADDIGLVVYNAAASPIGSFLDLDLDSLQRTVSVNIASPLDILHGAGRQLRNRYGNTRKRGGVILMSSLSALVGTPRISAYAASKAWAKILAEGVGRETAESGLDILVCIAGATDTPGYRDSVSTGAGTGAPVQSSRAVAREALLSLGRRNTVVTGRLNRIVAVLVSRILPRRLAVNLMAGGTSNLRQRSDTGEQEI